ncbi:MAG: histidine kinase, partial [Leptolyngbya sp. SIO3F4]|nr:histidine kinase [Leptolyngbya sp. SIO3F4]
KTLYFYPEYPDLYAEQIRTFGYLPLWERVANIPVTLSKSVFYFSPTLLLLLFQYYKNQQELLQLNEQKKTAELTALKHQLNPHFLFNTLNNLYALAIKKSDQTPEVIE